MSSGNGGCIVNIPERNIGTNLEADVVVIGGGGAGLPAALTAVEGGAKNVVVVEKRFATGGDGLRCNHIFAVGTHLQEEAGVTLTADEVFKTALEFHRYDRVNPRVLRALINQTADTIHWLESEGVEFKLLTAMSRDPKRVTTHVEKHMPEPDSLCSLGRVFRLLTQKSVDAGVVFLLRTSGKKIMRGADGKVSGVLAQTRDGKEIKIKTKAVILCPGSFNGNKELLKKYFPYYYDENSYMTDALLSNTGEGIQIAADAGAALADFCTLIRHAGKTRETTTMIRQDSRPPTAVWVNKRGQRYISESDHEVSGNVLIHQPGKIAYALIDDSMVQSVVDSRRMNPKQPRLPIPQEKAPDFRQYLQGGEESNRVKIADTWDGIAEWIGCEPKVLDETMGRYNSFCDQGYDEDFVKDSKFLVPLRTPPYYAIQFQMVMIETVGPVIINERMEVMDKQDEPIPGFFAAGVITSGWESYDYGGTPAGSALGLSLASGRIAGNNAAKYVLGK